jgi:hypothetical protein
MPKSTVRYMRSDDCRRAYNKGKRARAAGVPHAFPPSIYDAERRGAWSAGWLGAPLETPSSNPRETPQCATSAHTNP